MKNHTRLPLLVTAAVFARTGNHSRTNSGTRCRNRPALRHDFPLLAKRCL